MELKLRSFAIAALSILALACKEEPRNTEPLVDPWTRERTPVNVRLESQIGAAQISDNWRNDAEGSVHVSIITGALDLAKVKVVAVDFKYPDSEFCPTASIKAGDTVNLTSGSTTFVVTAYNGETRTYTLDYEQFTDPLEGVYVHEKIGGILDGGAPTSSMIVHGGWTGAEVMSTAMDKSWHWGEGYTPNDEEDNYISFALTAADPETGLTSGTCVNTAGEDGKYANYVYNNANDVNAFYRLVPVGSSRWAKDADGNVHFYAKDDEAMSRELYSISFLEAGAYQFGAASQTLNVPSLAIRRSFVIEQEVIDYNWPDTRWMVNNIRNTFWTVKKVSDSALENHSELF